MLTTHHTVLAAALTLASAGGISRAGFIGDPPPSNNVTVPSKSVGTLTEQEPVQFTSFGMFGTLEEPRSIAQQIYITTEDTASLPGGSEDITIALYDSVGDLLTIGAPGLNGLYSVIDYVLPAAGQHYIAVTAGDADFGDGFAVTRFNPLVMPAPYSLRIMTTPTPGAMMILGLGIAVAAKRRRSSGVA